MFIKKITLCNVFAYFGEVSVDFTPQPDKRLYCIYGNNGFGKTSFIRCAKLLFLGTEGVGSTANEVISRFAAKIKSPQQLILGNTEWNGVLNKAARLQENSEFFICFEGDFKGQSFALKRSWRLEAANRVVENLSLRLGHEEFLGVEAQLKANLMLPPNFVEFFFFDGEEIEKISDNLRTKLREKIEDILQIKPLDIITKMTKKKQEELKNSQIRDQFQAKQLLLKRQEAQRITENIASHNEVLSEFNKRLEECHTQLKEVENSLLKLISDTSKEQERLISAQQNTKQNIFEAKTNLTNPLKAVVLSGNAKLLAALQEELDALENSAQKDDIEAFRRLLPQILQLLSDRTQNLTQGAVFSELLSQMPEILEENIATKQSQIPLRSVKEIYGILHRNENNPLNAVLRKIQTLNHELLGIEDELSAQNTDEYTKLKQEELDAQKRDCELNGEKLQAEVKETQNQIQTLEESYNQTQREIYSIEQNISTERIEGKLEILDNLHNCIKEYKDRLVAKLREELHDEILAKHKLILPNDNIAELEISEDFAIKLKDKNGEEIVVESQSSGQKQILAISIFWALSELSNSQIPLIIDTPLSRIDAKNRANIIKHYYAKKTQVIILPHSGEIGKTEFELAKPHLAGLYQITNSNDRQHAKITPASIEEIL